MQFRFAHSWLDGEKTILRYTAKSGWNWRDYHACARIATVALPPRQTLIDILIDLTATDTWPAGLPAHTRTFGKRLVPSLSGYAAVIGMPDEVILSLVPDGSRYLATDDGQVYFAATEADAWAQLMTWREKRA